MTSVTSTHMIAVVPFVIAMLAMCEGITSGVAVRIRAAEFSGNIFASETARRGPEMTSTRVTMDEIRVRPRGAASMSRPGTALRFGSRLLRVRGTPDIVRMIYAEFELPPLKFTGTPQRTDRARPRQHATPTLPDALATNDTFRPGDLRPVRTADLVQASIAKVELRKLRDLAIQQRQLETERPVADTIPAKSPPAASSANPIRRNKLRE